jgi:protein phosphatase
VPRDVLRAAVVEANSRICSMTTAEAGLRPGSTVVVMLMHVGGAEVAHVGDSRVYLVHAGAISQVTRDHSMVQELVDRNIISAEDAARHPDANKILRALGIGKEVDVDVRPEPVAYVAGDTFILCSDGLSDLVTAAEILEVASDAPQQAAGRLIDLANARGGHDNITALIVRTKTSAKPDTAPVLMKTMPLGSTAKPPETVLEAPLGATVPFGGMPPGAMPPGALPPGAVPPGAVPPGAVPPGGMAPGGTAPGGTMQSPVHPAQQQQLAAAAPVPPVMMVPPQAVPYPGLPPDPASERAPNSSRLGIVLGLVAAVVALAVLALFGLNRFHTRKHVPLVDDPRKDAGAAVVEDEHDPSALPAIPSVAPLAPAPTPSATGKWDGVKSADPCVGAGRARANGASQQVIDRLEAKCRADGGTPQ